MKRFLPVCIGTVLMLAGCGNEGGGQIVSGGTSNASTNAVPAVATASPVVTEPAATNITASAGTVTGIGSGPPFSITSALAAFAAANPVVIFTGKTAGGAATTQTYSWSAGPNSDFGGTAATTMRETIASQPALSKLNPDVVIHFADSVSGIPLGSIDENSGQYSVVTAYTANPTTAQVGQSEIWETETVYADATQGSVIGSRVKSWTLTADSARTGNTYAVYCTIDTLTPAGADTTSTSLCYHVTSRGEVSAPYLTRVTNAGTSTLTSTAAIAANSSTAT